MAKKKKVSQLSQIELTLKTELSMWGERLAVTMDEKISDVENRLNARIGELGMKIDGFEKRPDLHLDNVKNLLDARIEKRTELLKDRTNSLEGDIETRNRNLEQQLKENISGVERSLGKKIGELDAKIFGLDCNLSEKIDERFNILEEKYFELRLHNAMEPIRSLSRNIGSSHK